MTLPRCDAPRPERAPRLGPLLAGTAVLALAMGAGVARGQTFIGNGVAFQGSASTALGNVTLANGNSTDTLTVNTPTAIVDWSPYDRSTTSTAPIAFLPNGSTGIFQNGGGGAGFTVLNRINAAAGRSVELDGHIVSQLIDAAGAVTRGGNVWFYAPGGLIIGSTGVFDVGSLILTTNAIDTTSDTVLPNPTSGLSFTGAGGSTAAIALQPGARINQPVAGSYLAMVAPRISQAGTVTVNGSVGYVAAQAADITINAGLFDITSAIGSTVAAGGETTLSHTGTTTGAAEASSTAPHVIYMIAVPANDAVTLLAAGTVGYQAASTATQVNGSVVLGAGLGFDAPPESYGNSETYPVLGSSAPANIAIHGGTFRSAINAQATNALTVDTSAGDLSLAGFLGQANGATALHVTAGHSITSSDELDIEALGPVTSAASLTMVVDAGGTLNVATLLQGARRGANGQSLTFDVGGTVTARDLDITATRIRAANDALGGTTTIDVAGSLTADNVYIGAIGQTDAGNATGGVAHLVVTGTATIGNLTLAAGSQAPATASVQTGGSAQGGSALVDVGAGGQLTISGTAMLDASANAPGAATATGGTAMIASEGGTIDLTGADATATLDASATGGTARGGIAGLSVDGNGSITVAGNLALLAPGSNGSGAGAIATGGTAQVFVDYGALTVGGTSTLDARGIAMTTSGGTATAPQGYDAIGGTASITAGAVDNDVPSSATFSGTVSVLGGAIAYQGPSVTTGSATGGSAGVTANSRGSIAFDGGLLLDGSATANAEGSDAGIASSGGTSRLDAVGGAITLASASPTSGLEFSADALGGTATAGIASLAAGGGGTITATSSLYLHARGAGGSLENGSIAGFDGTGGSTTITAADGTIALTGVELDPIGDGGNSVSFEGGTGTGGTASIATTDPAGRITIAAYANLAPFGGAGTGATGAAIGRGGRSSVTADGGTIDFTGDGTNPTEDPRYLGYSLYALAAGTGSDALAAGRDPASGGIGYGGAVSVTADAGGSIAIATNAYLSPSGTGGAGAPDGTAGAGIGGSVTLAALDSAGQVGTIAFGALRIDNGAFGGFGGTGGAATAGTSDIVVAQGASITGATLDAETYAQGGGGNAPDIGAATSGFTGGAAIGGSTTLTIDGGTLAMAGDTSGNPALRLVSHAQGGGGGNGGDGGAASGSAVTIAVDSGTLATPTLVANAITLGGTAGDGADTIGGNGGAATGGSVTLTIAGGAPTQNITAGALSVPMLTIGTTVTGGNGGSGGGFADDPTTPTPVQNGYAGGAGGTASGGTTAITLSGGTLETAALALAAATVGGNGGRGGDGAGSSADGGAALGGSGGAGGSAISNGATLSGFGGTISASTTSVTSLTDAGVGGAGGAGGTDPTSGGRIAATTGATGNARGGGATIETDFTGSANLGATTLSAGGTIGGTIEAGAITLAAHDSDGTAPATPLTLDSLTATMNATLTTTGDLIQITAAAPIAIANDATLSGFTLLRADMSGRGTLAVGGDLDVATLEVIGTQTDPTPDTIAITAGTAEIAASFAGVTLATLTTTSGALFVSAADFIQAGDLVSAGSATLGAGGSIGFDGLTAQNDIDITAGGALSGATLTSTTGAIDATAAGSSAIATVAAGGEIEITAGGSGHYGTVTGGTDPGSERNDGGTDFGSVALTAGGDLTIDASVVAYQSVGLVAGGALSGPYVSAANGGSIGVISGGATTLGTIVAPDLFYVGGASAIAGLDPDASAAEIVAAVRTAGPTATGGDVFMDGGPVGSAIIDAGGRLSMVGTITATGDATLRAGDVLQAGTVSVGGTLDVLGQSTVTIGQANAGLDLIVAGRDDTTVTTATAGRDALIYTFIAGDDTALLSRSTTVGSVTAGDDAIVTAWGAVDVGSITTTGLGADGTSPTPSYLDVPGSGVTLYGGTGIHVGTIVAQSSVFADNLLQTINGVEQAHGTGGVTIDSLSTGGAVTLNSERDAVTATILAAGPITATGTAVTLTAPTASLRIALATASAGDVAIEAGGDLTARGAITSTTGDIDLSAGGAVDVVSLSAGDSATVSAGTTLHAGSIAVGTDTTSAANDGTGVFGSLGLIAGGAITVDTPFVVTGSVGLVSRTAGIDLDSLTAGANGSVAVLAGGDIRLGTVSAPNLLYVGGPAAIAGLTGDPGVAEILGVLGRAGPVASGGAVTIGQATTGTATISAGTTLTLTGPLSTSIGAATLASAGDLLAQNVTANGAVSAGSRGGAVTIGTVAAGTPTVAGGIRLTAAQAVTAGPLAASGSIGATSTGAGLGLQDVTSTGGGVIATAGGGDIALGTVRAAGSITIAGTGAIVAGDLTAGTGPLLPGESGSGATDPATGGIAGGFDGDAIPRCDDCSTDMVTLPFTVNYFGQNYSTTYVSNNGYLTFNQGQGAYTPSGLGTGYSGLPIIAAFFADVDTSNGLSAQATYGSSTFAGRQAFGATWNGVGYYPGAADKLNNFQIILTNRSDTGAGNFDIYYNYTNIGWETGGASGGINGFGGTSAAVGYNAGTGNQAGTFFELPGSRVPGSFINGGTAPLAIGTNDGIAGQLLFTVRNGQVSTGAASEPPSIHVSNLGGTGTSDIRLGNLSAEGAEVHGTGRVTVGTVDVGDRGSGITAPGQAFATVLDAGLGLSAGDVSSTGLIALGSRTGDVSAGTIAGGASVIALADGSVTLARVTTGTATGDTLYVGGAATDALSGFAFTSLLAGHGFDPATLASATPAAAGGTITIAGPVSTGNLRAAANGAITLADVGATGAILIDGGAALATGALSAGGAITASAGGDASIGATTASEVTATSGGALSFGATDATNGVTLTTARTLSLASIDATTIALNAADIAIASGAAIGSARTSSVAFTNTGAGRTVIGDGAGAADGDYALSATELASVHGNAIAIGPQARDGATADTLIGSFTLNGPAQSGGNLVGSKAGFAVASAGAIRVVGAAHFTGLASDDGVTLRSTGGDITGVLPAGSIVLDNGTGGLAGTLSLAANTILFATPDAASAIGTATTPAAIDSALGDPGTLANPAGYLRADTVSVRFANAFYTQNSGASSAIADRAGVTAGSGGIVLIPTTTQAASPTRLVLNARLERDGATLTGNQVFRALALQPTGFATGATLDGCLLDATNCGITAPTIDPQAVTTALVQSIQPVQDVVAQVKLSSGLGNAVEYSFTTPALISTIDLTPPALLPQIDEPVTGAGNESLWVNIGIGRELAPMGGKADATRP